MQGKPHGSLRAAEIGPHRWVYQDGPAVVTYDQWSTTTRGTRAGVCIEIVIYIVSIDQLDYLSPRPGR